MVRLENNRAVKVLGNIGRQQREVEIAINMLRDGDDVQKISRITGLSIERIIELQTEVRAG